MRDIQVSTDVFARIWSLRTKTENTEDEILKRVLWQISDVGQHRGPGAEPRTTEEFDGIYDRRFNVMFPEGFRLERTYLGKDYSAVVNNGQWQIAGVGHGYTRLNELSVAIGTKTENAWANWFYRDENGQRHPVSDLRDPGTIARKNASNRQNRNVRNLNSDKPSPHLGTHSMSNKIRWCDDVKTALEQMGGQASLHRIYQQVAKIRKSAGRSVPPSLEATIRRTLEDFSSDSENYRGEDWFTMPEGKGSGFWALRE